MRRPIQELFAPVDRFLFQYFWGLRSLICEVVHLVSTHTVPVQVSNQKVFFFNIFILSWAITFSDVSSRRQTVKVSSFEFDTESFDRSIWISARESFNSVFSSAFSHESMLSDVALTSISLFELLIVEGCIIGRIWKNKMIIFKGFKIISVLFGTGSASSYKIGVVGNNWLVVGWLVVWMVKQFFQKRKERFLWFFAWS